MSKRIRLALILVMGVFIAAQLFPVARSNPPVTGEIGVPDAVREILRTSCYDCHSNETAWPWYSYVAPVSWLVVHDVHEGREHLNFSEWNQLADQKRAKLLEEIGEEVGEGEMPLPLYLTLHSEARLDDAAQEQIRAWTHQNEEDAP